MMLKLRFSRHLCSDSEFSINGVTADYCDFGDKYDRSPDTAEDYACGNMVFSRIPPTPEILKKYKISEAEYELVAEQLEEGLSFGNCGWCV